MGILRGPCAHSGLGAPLWPHRPQFLSAASCLRPTPRCAWLCPPAWTPGRCPPSRRRRARLLSHPCSAPPPWAASAFLPTSPVTSMLTRPTCTFLMSSSLPCARNILLSAYRTLDLDCASLVPRLSQTELPQTGILGSLLWSIPNANTMPREFSDSSIASHTCSSPLYPTLPPTKPTGSAFLAGSTAQPSPSVSPHHWSPTSPFPSCSARVVLLKHGSHHSSPSWPAEFSQRGFPWSGPSCWFLPLAWPGPACSPTSRHAAHLHTFVLVLTLLSLHRVAFRLENAFSPLKTHLHAPAPCALSQDTPSPFFQLPAP